MTVKNVEIFEKVVPLFVSMTRLYPVEEIKSIFEYCRKQSGYNFAAIKRIRQLISIVYNNRQNRLDLPIKEFMDKTYEFSEAGETTKRDLNKFINDFALDYAKNASTDQIMVYLSPITMKNIQEIFMDIFRCLVDVSHSKRGGKITMTRVDLLWKERQEFGFRPDDERVFVLAEFLDNIDIKTEQVEDFGD